MQGLELPFGLQVVVVDLLLFERELCIHFPGKELLVEHPDQQEEQKDGTGGADIHSHKVAAAVKVLSNFVGLFLCSSTIFEYTPERAVLDNIGNANCHGSCFNSLCKPPPSSTVAAHTPVRPRNTPPESFPTPENHT